MEVLVSVIIPVYNREDYIKDCVESLQNQTHKNLEIIVINDGSFDATEKIVSRMAEQDPRIRIKTVPNSGVTAARNTGIALATGDYIGFVDSDDTVEPDMYEILLRLVKEHDVQIAHCGYNSVENSVVTPINGTEKLYEMTGTKANDYMLRGKLFAGGLWNKLYERSLFEGVKIPEHIKINEDILANVMLFDKCKKSVFYDVPKYNYFIRKAVNTARSLDPVVFSKKLFLAAEAIYDYSRGKEFEKAASYNYTSRLAGLCKATMNTKDKKKRKDILKKVQFVTANNFEVAKRNKVVFTFYRHFRLLYPAFMFFYDKIRTPNLDVK